MPSALREARHDWLVLGNRYDRYRIDGGIRAFDHIANNVERFEWRISESSPIVPWLMSLP